MIGLRKGRYKPLYKKFLRLREDVQFKRKFINKKLKKKKWQSFMFFFNLNIKRRKKNFKIHDQSCTFFKKFGKPIKRNYKYTLQTKQKFRLFYGQISNKYLKNTIFSKKLFKKSFLSIIMSYLELRLDVILHRVHFCPSIREARNFINKKNIYVNNKLHFSSRNIVKKGDLIFLSNKAETKALINTFSHHLWPIIPKNIHVNYRTLEVVILNSNKFQLVFPFFFNIHILKRYFF